MDIKTSWLYPRKSWGLPISAIAPIYIGDLSKADAELLVRLSRGAVLGILEFGVGASTQIFAQSTTLDKVVSVDTAAQWIERTKNNLSLLGIPNKVDFQSFYVFLEKSSEAKFDLIFNDGDPLYRYKFAEVTWPLLIEGGSLLFHDTRKETHLGDVTRFFSEHAKEISNLQINIDNSNISVITKGALAPYEDWNAVEGRQPWEYGNLSVGIPTNARELLLTKSGAS